MSDESAHFLTPYISSHAGTGGEAGRGCWADGTERGQKTVMCLVHLCCASLPSPGPEGSKHTSPELQL